MVAAFEGPPEPWLAVNRALRDAVVSYAAERCPYYRAAIGPGGFDAIPILTKGIVRERFDDLLAEGVHRDRWAPWRTSGSTGEPMAFVRDTAQGYLENLSAQRFLRWMHGIPPDATTVWVAARPVGAPGKGRRWPLGRRADPEVHPVSTMDLTPQSLEPEVRRWNRFRIWFLYGHASAIAWAAEEIERRGLELRPPVAVVTTSDMLTGHAAGRIGRAFRVPVHSWYGSNEMNGFVAGTVPGTRRFAFNPLLVYAEVVDDDGRPLPPGEAGRLVLTDLNNLVMPFIRYETGDLAVASPERSIGGFRLIEDLVGRDSEVLRLPSGKVLNAVTLGNALFVTNDFVDDVAGFQCAKVGPNHLELRVVWAGEGSPPEAAVAEACRAAADPDTEVTVRSIDRLATLPSGKAWIIRDETGTAGSRSAESGHRSAERPG